MEQKNIWQKTWFVCLAAIFCNILWGSAFPGIKSGYAIFEIGAADTASQILFAGCRFFLAGFLVIAFHSLTQKRVVLPQRGEFGGIVKTSSMQTIAQYVFFYVSLAHTTGVKGSILAPTSVFFGILITCLIVKLEKLTAQKLIGCIVGFAGVVLINLSGEGNDMGLHPLGDSCMIISALCNGISVILIKKHSQKINPIVLNGYQFMFGGAVMALAALLLGGRLHNVSFAGIGVLLYLAFLSATAYTIWSILLKHNPVTKITIFSFTNPIFGVMLSAWILGESTAFGLRGWLALACVSAGVIFVNSDKKGFRRSA
ncbi:MAG: DMT family transporter [Oscillospiraceae bacterium]|nr:DMT family transporter [Oscillospiraceae bacterium]